MRKGGVLEELGGSEAWCRQDGLRRGGKAGRGDGERTETEELREERKSKSTARREMLMRREEGEGEKK